MSTTQNLFFLTALAFVIAGGWQVFAKAGQPGWAILVPFYNIYVLTQIVGRPWWWLLLCLVPFVSIVIAIILCIDLAKAFGRGAGFGVGLFFLSPIFMCILGFGSDTYKGAPSHA
ncbi:MAG: DUF5684 domain-containing protein [Opitutaceae bacterium]|nr:DUF5684 domain-containing protein [Opitutaceae bacterium]